MQLYFCYMRCRSLSSQKAKDKPTLQKQIHSSVPRNNVRPLLKSTRTIKIKDDEHSSRVGRVTFGKLGDPESPEKGIATTTRKCKAVNINV